jgi:hypothetical protein
VTSSDEAGGLVFLRERLASPASFSVTVPRPARGPRLTLHLLHSSILGLDAKLIVEPT